MNTRTLTLLLTLSLSIATTGCQLLGKSGTNGIRGGMQVAGEQLSGTATPGAPRTVYVADFKLDASTIKTDPGIGGVPDQVEQSGGLLARLSQRRLRQPAISGSPEDKARQIANVMAEDLVKSLRDQGLAAERIGSGTGSLPKEGWLIQGNFTDVDEGNRLERSAIGFGLGSTQMQIQVGVSDLASPQPTKPFISFGTVKDPSMMPGAAYNPYALAVKFHLQKKATEEDIQKTADLIVAELSKYRDAFKAEARKNAR